MNYAGDIKSMMFDYEWIRRGKDIHLDLFWSFETGECVTQLFIYC